MGREHYCSWVQIAPLVFPLTIPAYTVQVSEESDLLREFLGVTDRVSNSVLGEDLQVDAVSMVSACELGTGSVAGSALTNVRCNHIEAEDCILVNVTAKRIIASKWVTVR